MAPSRLQTGSSRVGIMTDRDGLPSNNFLFSEIVSADINSDLVLTDLSWRVPVSPPLWLSVIESPEFSFGLGYWQGNLGLSQPWAFKATLDGPWFASSGQTPAARIITAEVPEPASLLLVLAALLGWALTGSLRKQSKGDTTPGT